MRALALSALAGTLGALCVVHTPATPVLATLSALLLLAVRRGHAARLLAAALLGFAWGANAALAALAERLPAALKDEVVWVGGRVAEFPLTQNDSRQFVLAQARARHGRESLEGIPARLLIVVDAGMLAPALGDWCELAVRLQRPRGLANPGGSDRERLYLARHIGARGRVLRHPGNLCLAATDAQGVSRLRQAISGAIDAALPDAATAAVLRALTVDDRSGLDEQQWAVMQATGTGHLLSISGLHVSIIALGAFGCCRRVAALVGHRRQSYPAIRIGWYAAMAAALVYAALAGFGVPVARAALMVCTAAVAGLAQRRVLGFDTWLAALLLLVAWDPLCLLGSGTWLSFGAVAMLILLADSDLRGVLGTLRSHLLLTLAMAPLTALLFGQLSWTAPFANLLAVPLTSVLVVPLALAGVACLPWHAALAGLLWDMAGRLWSVLWWLLTFAADSAPAVDVSRWFWPVPSLIAALGLACLAAPAALRLRATGVVLLCSLLLPREPPLATGAFRLRVLDVGQGLAVVIETRHSVTLYDTGPRWHGSARDAGGAIVLPALAALGLTRLDTLVVSHADSDHAGGLASVLRALPPRRLVWSQPVRGVRAHQALACEAGMQWQHDGVQFVFLHPRATDAGERNARSCVLMVSGRHGRALLAGDIEAPTEALLVARYGAGLAAEVLVVPHHGSASSSTAAFLARVRPRHALISAGHANRYGQPHAAVVTRYLALPSVPLNTAETGAVTVDFSARAPRVSLWRAGRIGFWHAAPVLPGAALSGGGGVW